MRLKRTSSAPLPGMVQAEALPRARRLAAANDSAAQAIAPTDPALAARRERLAERLTMLQLELGGVYYEMAIRDHLVPEVLNERAARLQQVDAELAYVDALIESGAGSAAGACPECGAPHARGAPFCWQCGTSLGIDATHA
jgi:hypothetical protein